MSQKTVDLRTKRDLDLDEITIRTTNGDDTLDAAARSIPIDGGEIQPNIFGLTMRQQTLAGAIVSFKKRGDSETRTCNGPCLESLKWNSRTREYVAEIYDYLNGVTQEERDGFRAELAGSADKS